MSTWDELRELVDELRDDPRRPLRGFVSSVGERPSSPPFHLSLAAWAVDLAQSVHSRFGEKVAITVGALHYPDRTFDSRAKRSRERQSPEGLSRLPDEVDVILPFPLVVRSGFDERGVLEFHNQGRDELVIQTNGVLTARIVLPSSDEVIGGLYGYQALPLVIFRCAAGERVAIPLLVGTTSFVPALGYAIPPGEWLIEVPIRLQGLGPFLTPRLPLTVGT